MSIMQVVQPFLLSQKTTVTCSLPTSKTKVREVLKCNAVVMVTVCSLFLEIEVVTGTSSHHRSVPILGLHQTYRKKSIGMN